VADARGVAHSLGFPHYVVDEADQFERVVIDYFSSEYQAGRTPNPDIMCNQEVKFKLFLKTALEDGADMIATGHYARIKDGKLYAGLDKNKDQSYFLYRVTKDALKKSLMPIGEMEKSEVRARAKNLGLATADKKDSQGICFVGKVGIKEFLLNELGQQKPGPILDQNGKEIGQHEGAIFYTIGQRHGLNVGGGLPYYVTRKDMKKNEVHVTTDINDKELWSKDLHLKDLHWINEAPKAGKTYDARLRYRGPLVGCTIKGSNLVLKEEQRGLAAGQSAVLYDGDQVLGGAIMRF
jgi:tRNA-specific 2-thiouridylase